MKLVKLIREGECAPRFYLPARYDLMTRVHICYPFPIAILARLWIKASSKLLDFLWERVRTETIAELTAQVREQRDEIDKLQDRIREFERKERKREEAMIAYDAAFKRMGLGE